MSENTMWPISRRQFLVQSLLSGLLLTAPGLAQASPALTARDIVERIKKACAEQGINWSDKSIDTFKVGNPDTVVTGVISTFSATIDVMRQAVAKGANFIISHEPIFYNHMDDTSALKARQDPVYLAKTGFAEANNLVVWRFHDHFHRLTPEPVTTVLYNRLGWDKFPSQGQGFSRSFEHPEVTLKELADIFARQFPSGSVRFVGDPSQKISRVSLTSHSISGVINTFKLSDAGVSAEVREWDSVEYTRDANELGLNKGLVLIAHERGEQFGMKYIVPWLSSIVTELPVTFINSQEPFRTIKV
ncbi:Nif3-like dinuclear metal center hexameric protein [Alteromonas lipolytica]|uniref:NGG1p interacting factor NIF3 n=1 Tax=Alteromonas lipolytica TaxID=1856405 RepID=A0A1E8FI44_9ALTE|nr:Nif3-like dinuclear metal center hexameric protein [Alteromonas lipolytica]OFI35610.1 hypothetical protein BFC17_12705 [Alteromonas lipolytica]GGF77565.1 hypothetical protein GCM10011338_32430 [Alteromonas lipolytica]